MARLTAFSRLLIAGLIVAAVYFAVRTFLPQLQLGGIGGSSTTTTGTTATGPAADNGGGTTTGGDYQPAGSGGAGTSTGSGASSAGFARQSFSYAPTAPINGKLKGVVEMGATGFNSFVVRIDKQKNWKLEKADFGASLVYENLATDQDIRDGLKQYIADMVAYGVSPRDIHFVISSGAKKSEVTDKIISTLQGMKYFVNTVTAEKEGQLALKCVMPTEYSGRGFVVDIGSGNTKISWKDRGDIRSLETYGAKYFQNNTSAATVFSDVQGKARQVPSAQTGTCFIIGGVPFEFAKKIRNGKERFTVLPAPADLKAEGDKQAAGLNIYNAIAQATGCKQFVFDWDSNFTIGFLLELP
jgi:hypothetical protein